MKNITWTRKARIGFDTLDAREGSIVVKTLKRLRDDSSTPKQKLAGMEGSIYMARAGRSLRVIFENSDDAITVLDITDPDRLKWFQHPPTVQP